MRKIICGIFAVIVLLGMAGCRKTGEDTLSPFAGQTENGNSTESARDNENKEMTRESENDMANIATFNFETKTVLLNSGYEMPLNGIGTYSLTDEVCIASVSTALEKGVRLIDTAYMYHNEAEVGKAVRDSGIPREEIFVITKIYPSQFDEPEQAIDEALQKLDIGYIDLMLLHHPWNK